jgi:EAL domain-containing protein (putative c-di-GMP-specific phosphodiesterase class I)/FixJ family two-component response regulator
MINELSRWLRPEERKASPVVSERHYIDSAPPVCFVVDEEEKHRHFMSLVLQGHGIETGLFTTAPALKHGLARRRPDLVFLDVPVVPTNAMEAVRVLVAGDYHGPLQLMSERPEIAVESVRQLGARNELRMLMPVKKPVERAVIKRVIQEQKLDVQVSALEKVSLETALKEDWIEFWYQPKIDLRVKRLAGVELFARVRHPQHGMMSPAAFMDGADEKSLVALIEKSIIDALKIGAKFTRLGIHLRLAVNVSVTALTKLSLPRILGEYLPNLDNWPGLILDITEDQIASDYSLVREVHAQLEASGISLAIDDFGQGYVPLSRMQELPPFAELKLDRAFVADCAIDRGHAAICKSVIDLAHNFGAKAVGVGVEKPGDANALMQMDCDLGQGYLFAQPMAEDRFLALLRQRAERPVRQAGPGQAR